MKSTVKKTLGVTFILTILLLPTVNALQTTDSESEDVLFAVSSWRNKVMVSIANYGNESVNYTFVMSYGFARPLLLRLLPPRFIYDNGTLGPNSTIQKTYRVRFSYSPLFAILTVDNTSLIGIGYVHGRRARFRSMIVQEGSPFAPFVEVE
jgi:hypothetical protein